MGWEVMCAGMLFVVAGDNHDQVEPTGDSVDGDDMVVVGEQQSMCTNSQK